MQYHQTLSLARGRGSSSSLRPFRSSQHNPCLQSQLIYTDHSRCGAYSPKCSSHQGASSPVPLTSEPVPVCCACDVQSLLFHQLEQLAQPLSWTQSQLFQLLQVERHKWEGKTSPPYPCDFLANKIWYRLTLTIDFGPDLCTSWWHLGFCSCSKLICWILISK